MEIAIAKNCLQINSNDIFSTFFVFLSLCLSLFLLSFCAFHSLFLSPSSSSIVCTTQIYQLIDYVINIDYDIFRPGNLENWEASLKLFDKRLQQIERDAKNLIDKCIPTMRSTEMAIELIKTIEQLNTRKCLVDHMLTKHDSIVHKFISEIETIEQEFRVWRWK